MAQKEYKIPRLALWNIIHKLILARKYHTQTYSLVPPWQIPIYQEHLKSPTLMEDVKNLLSLIQKKILEVGTLV